MYPINLIILFFLWWNRRIWSSQWRCYQHGPRRRQSVSRWKRRWLPTLWTTRPRSPPTLTPRRRPKRRHRCRRQYCPSSAKCRGAATAAALRAKSRPAATPVRRRRAKCPAAAIPARRRRENCRGAATSPSWPAGATQTRPNRLPRAVALRYLRRQPTASSATPRASVPWPNDGRPSPATRRWPAARRRPCPPRRRHSRRRQPPSTSASRRLRRWSKPMKRRRRYSTSATSSTPLCPTLLVLHPP